MLVSKITVPTSAPPLRIRPCSRSTAASWLDAAGQGSSLGQNVERGAQGSRSLADPWRARKVRPRRDGAGAPVPGPPAPVELAPATDVALPMRVAPVVVAVEPPPVGVDVVSASFQALRIVADLETQRVRGRREDVVADRNELPACRASTSFLHERESRRTRRTRGRRQSMRGFGS